MRRTVETGVVGNRWLWLRVLGMVVLGAFLLLLVSLPGLASDQGQWSPGLAWYLMLAAVLAAVMSRTYVLVRRSAVSRLRAVLVSVAVILGSYCAAILFLWLVVTLSSSA